MKRVLFICSRNRWRSPTAESIFADRPGIEVDSAGLSRDAEVVLSRDQVEWADLILVMEPVHRQRLNARFGKYLKGKKVAVLGIPDRFQYMDEALVARLEKTCSRYW